MRSHFSGDWRNYLIAGLISLSAVLGILLLWGRAGEGLFFSTSRSGRPVEVLEVSLDREGRRQVDIVFGSTVGKGRVGEVLGREPAKINPSVGGSWRWHTPAVLRYEATSPFAPATEYLIALEPAQFLQEDQYLSGDQVFRVITDRFRIEHVEVREKPLPAGEVMLEGEILFNYPVDRQELTCHLKLTDAGGKAVGFRLEAPSVSEAIRLRTEPLQKRVEERSLQLEISPRLTPSGGNVQLGTAFSRAILIGSNTRLAVREVKAQALPDSSRLEILFSSPVEVEELRRHLSLEPPAEIQMNASDNQVWLSGDLRPGNTYQVLIAKGLKGTDTSTLSDDFKRTVRIPDLAPTLRFKHQGLFLSAAGTRNVAVEAVNTRIAEIVVDRVHLNNIFTLVQHVGYQYRQTSYWGGYLPHGLGDRLLTEKLLLAVTPNQTLETTLDIGSMIDPTTPGLYRVALRRAGQYKGDQRWILITDVGIVAKQGQSDFLVWAASFRNLQPIPHARVDLFSDQNQKIASGRTDSTGLWKVSKLDLNADRPYLVTVQKGQEFSFLLLPQARVDTSGLDVSGAGFPVTGYQAFLYGERDIYRPGEAVKGVALIRDDRRLPAPRMPVVLTHLDPNGRERATIALEMPAPGLAEFMVPTEPYDRTGNHQFQLKLADRVVGTYRFQLEEFVPDRIKVGLENLSFEDRDGDPELAFDVEASYLFGAPAARLRTEIRVFLEPSSFVSPEHPDFRFGNTERKFNRRRISDLSETLSDQGQAHFQVTVPRGLRPASSLSAVITARVQEQGGRGVTATRRHPVHVYSNYLGLKRAGSGYAEPGQESAFEYVSLDPEGQIAPAGPLQLRIFKDQWQTVLRRTPSGAFRYESVRDPRLVHSDEFDSGSSRGRFSFTPAEFGSYRVVLEDAGSGTSTQLSFYASGWGYSPWAIENPSRLELELDREEYLPGQTAKLQIRTPFPGRLLLAVESQRVHFFRTYDLEGNTATIRVPIQAAYSPNAYLTATLVRSVGDLGSELVARAFGAIPIRVDRSSHRLPVRLEVPETVLPEGELEVEVATRAGAAVTIAAVDEGILQLIAQATPDPFEFFYRKLRLGVSTHDIFSTLLPDVPEMEGASLVGGGADRLAETQMVRTESLRRREPVSFWSGVVRADRSGRARVTFQVPEFQGALRVMAIASEEADFGSAGQLTRVRSPLILMPTFPRFLSLEEELEIPVTLRNDTGRDGAFEVRLGLEGPARLTGPATREISIPAGQERTTYFQARSLDLVGEVKFDLSASGDDAAATHSRVLSIRPDLPPRTTQVAGRVDSAALELPPQDHGFRPSTVTRTLTVGPLPMTHFTANLGNLLRYPYGCLEQTTSRILPLIFFTDLVKSLEPELFVDSDPAAMVYAGLRRLVGMQLISGGFAMWPGSRKVNPWASTYATHAMVEATRAGFHVDESIYDKAVGFLDTSVRSHESRARAGVEQLVYALYVLARADRPERGQMDFVRHNLQEFLRPSARGLLAATYAMTGNHTVANQLLASLEPVEEAERETGRNFDSATRNRALLLLALSETVPEDPRVAELYDRLAREASARSWTTQETSFAFLALGQLAGQQRDLQADYEGEVFVAGQLVGGFDSSTRSFVLPPQGRVRVQLASGYQAGSAFFSLVTRGIPLDSAFREEQQGLELEREFRTRRGRQIDLTQIRQGELIIVKTRIRSVRGPVENVVIQQLLPSGLEVENPRLATTERQGWMTGTALGADYQDLRDDRVLFFTDLPANQWRTAYTLLRAVSPGDFRVPPVHAEAMYNPELNYTGPRSRLQIGRRE